MNWRKPKTYLSTKNIWIKRNINLGQLMIHIFNIKLFNNILDFTIRFWKWEFNLWLNSHNKMGSIHFGKRYFDYYFFEIKYNFKRFQLYGKQ